jgi:hypothetical protein
MVVHGLLAVPVVGAVVERQVFMRFDAAVRLEKAFAYVWTRCHNGQLCTNLGTAPGKVTSPAGWPKLYLSASDASCGAMHRAMAAGE